MRVCVGGGVQSTYPLVVRDAVWKSVSRDRRRTTLPSTLTHSRADTASVVDGSSNLERARRVCFAPRRRLLCH